MLATSSYVSGNLTSYRTVNVTLQGTLDLYVTLTREGQTDGNVEDEYYVLLVTDSGEIPLSMVKPTPTTYAHHVEIRIPDDAMIGDVVTINVIDNSTGDLVRSVKLFVPDAIDGSTFINADVTSTCGCPYRAAVPLLLALLPGLLILAFALSLYYENGHRRKGLDSTG